MEHPQFADLIPDGALVVMQIEGDEAFNELSRSMSQRLVQKGEQIVHVKIKKLRPVHSRIEKLELVY